MKLLADRPHYVYRCWAGEQLLYIGCARDVEGRIYHHTALCNRGNGIGGPLSRQMTHYTSEEYPNRRAALDAERAAIKTELPLLNTQSKPKKSATTIIDFEPESA